MADQPTRHPHWPADDRSRGAAEEPEPISARVAQGVARLLPDIDRPGGWLLTVAGAPQSYVDLNDPRYLEFEYARRIRYLVDAALPDDGGSNSGELRALHLGAGALSLPRYLVADRPTSRHTVIDADTALLDFVREHLPWSTEHIEAQVADARAMVEQAPAASYDLVVADVFNGSRVPARVTSIEFMRACARVLRPGGLYAANIADGDTLGFSRSQAATLLTVFPHAYLIAEPSLLRGRRFGNVVLAGSDRPLPVRDLLRDVTSDMYPASLLHGSRLIDYAAVSYPVTDADAVPSPPPPDGVFTIE